MPRTHSACLITALCGVQSESRVTPLRRTPSQSRNTRHDRLTLSAFIGPDGVPVYEFTFEDVGKYRDEPVLPFNAFGTMAMARRESEPNSASSQFFFLLKESELTPSGTNILDGRYAVFGYVIEGQELLREVKAGDKIVSIKIVDGAENLVNKSAKAVPVVEEIAENVDAQ